MTRTDQTIPFFAEWLAIDVAFVCGLYMAGPALVLPMTHVAIILAAFAIGLGCGGLGFAWLQVIARRPGMGPIRSARLHWARVFASVVLIIGLARLSPVLGLA
ncbi:hypothetical protein [Woodsholea maritima]|uniref:hypothetical protein n=1 Tax=Woodsholea maritima TaxID=240237 RepID=UPI00035DF842|nr:hypothetical protein [Woodsholea maritima]